jgi:16S rRNA (guanine527-N7)-methyltransferase
VQTFSSDTYELTGVRLSPWQLDTLEQYRRLLLEWNRIHNLTAIRAPDEIDNKHFLDSLSCVLAFRPAMPARLVDIGTGAGFPGLVLKILYPGMKLTLVESVRKKLDFCRMLAEKIGLEGVTFLNARAEDVGQMKEHREQYDWAVARAVANMPVLAEYLLPLVRRGGAMLAMKGETAPVEAHNAEHAFQLLGGHLRKLVPVTLPRVAEQRYLVIVDKVATTPEAYPRRTGLPAKRPLVIKSQSLPEPTKQD